MLDSLIHLIHRWFPKSPNQDIWAPKLVEFYEQNVEYHEMTSSPGKVDHPQVKLLNCLIQTGETYAEVGCGSSPVCNMVSHTGKIYGIDVSPIAIQRARELCTDSNAEFICSPAESLPLDDQSVSGCYSFEVLEHVWNPVLVLREMVRITKPGGFILISTPNHFSLDLHLKKSTPARMVDIFMASCRYLHDLLLPYVYSNLEPDLEGRLYADCDMITSIHPLSFPGILKKMGCTVDFCDTTYMCAHRDDMDTSLDFQRNAGRPFLRHFGDHILLLAHRAHI